MGKKHMRHDFPKMNERLSIGSGPCKIVVQNGNGKAILEASTFPSKISCRNPQAKSSQTRHVAQTANLEQQSRQKIERSKDHASSTV